MTPTNEQNWEKEFDDTYLKYSHLFKGYLLPQDLAFIKSFFTEKIHEAKQAGIREGLKRAKEITKESFWQCPEHGLPKAPPACEECTDSLSVNVILHNLEKSINRELQSIDNEIGNV